MASLLHCEEHVGQQKGESEGQKDGYVDNSTEAKLREGDPFTPILLIAALSQPSTSNKRVGRRQLRRSPDAHLAGCSPQYILVQQSAGRGCQVMEVSGSVGAAVGAVKFFFRCLSVVSFGERPVLPWWFSPSRVVMDQSRGGFVTSIRLRRPRDPPTFSRRSDIAPSRRT